MEEYSTFFYTGRNARLAVAGYQEMGIDYLKLSLVQLIHETRAGLFTQLVVRETIEFSTFECG